MMHRTLMDIFFCITLFIAGEEQSALENTAHERQCARPETSEKATKTCHTCKQPMRGH